MARKRQASSTSGGPGAQAPDPPEVKRAISTRSNTK
jgi:hypothetical protein